MAVPIEPDRPQRLIIDSYLTVPRTNQRGDVCLLCAVFMRVEEPTENVPMPEGASSDSLGHELNQLVKDVCCPAYFVGSPNERLEQIIQSASLVANEPEGGVELIVRKIEHLSLSFSRRIWQRLGGFDEALPNGETLADFAGRVIRLRECKALEVYKPA